MGSTLANIRFLPALIGGIVIGLALFLMMHAMISNNKMSKSKVTQVNLVNFVQVQKQPPVTTIQRVHPPPPPPPKNPPPRTQVNTTQASNVQQSQLPVNVKFDNNSLGNGGGVFIGNPNATGPATDAGGNAPLTPEILVQPLYPPDAEVQGVEGTVSTCFTVEPDGSVSNPHVIGASSPQARQMLSQSALQNILQWKFFPEKINGKPVASPPCGVRQVITFKLPGGKGSQ